MQRVYSTNIKSTIRYSIVNKRYLRTSLKLKSNINIDQSSIQNTEHKQEADEWKEYRFGPYHSTTAEDWNNIGATNYLYKFKPTGGKIKQSIEDWIVQEVDSNIYKTLLILWYFLRF